MSECYSGKMSEGDRCNHVDGKCFVRMMDDSKRSDSGNKHAAAGTKLPSVNKHGGNKHGAAGTKLPAVNKHGGNKHAAAATKLPFVNKHGGNKHGAAGTNKLSSVNKQDSKMRSRWSFKNWRMATASPLMVWIIIAAPLFQPVQCGYITVDVITDEFNLTETPHAEVLGAIHAIAADAMPWLEVQGHRYLGAKDPQPSEFGGDGSGPSRWIKVPFRGETDEDRATIALADNDMCVVAFMNNIGTWHCFKGYEDMFPDCVVLNSGLDERGLQWDESYPKLIEGGFEMLHTVPLGNKSDSESTRTLAGYRHGISISSLIELKNALVRKKIMYSEAVNIRAIRETFSGDLWETETHISPEQAQLILHWGKISYYLWRWDSEGGEFLRDREEIEIGQKTGITSAHKALEAYDLLRRPQVIRIRVPRD